jgi:hypothetical protein
MVNHTVLFRFKEAATSESIDKMMKAIYTFKESIPGIIDVFGGENFSSNSKSYTHGVTIHFVDRSALEAYIAHPFPKDIRETLIVPILDDAINLDYEF